MKIEYKFKDESFMSFYEGQVIMSYRNKIIKKNNTRLHGPIQKIIHDSLLMLILMCIFKFLGTDKTIICVYLVLGFLAIFLSVLTLLTYYRMYKQRDNSMSGTLIFDKKGIKDVESDRELFLSWDKIQCLYIKDYSCVFITNDNVFMFLEKEYKDDLVKAVKKYNKDLLIIDREK